MTHDTELQAPVVRKCRLSCDRARTLYCLSPSLFTLHHVPYPAHVHVQCHATSSSVCPCSLEKDRRKLSFARRSLSGRRLRPYLRRPTPFSSSTTLSFFLAFLVLTRLVPFLRLSLFFSIISYASPRYRPLWQGQGAPVQDRAPARRSPRCGRVHRALPA